MRDLKQTTETSSGDLVWGGGAIGEVIGKDRRATFWLLENGRLPAKKIGRNWVASRKKLLAHLVGDAA